MGDGGKGFFKEWMITLQDAQRSAAELESGLERLANSVAVYDLDTLKAKLLTLSEVAANIARIVGENLPLEDEVLSEPGEFADSLGDVEC